MNLTRFLLFVAFFIGLLNIALYITQDKGFSTKIARAEFTEDSGFEKISTSGLHTCGIGNLGAVWCWGDNSAGQLGTGHFTSTPTPSPVVGLPGPALDVSVGGSTSCALLKTGNVWCWGSNGQGQLNKEEKIILSPIPLQIQKIGDISAISVGMISVCAAQTIGGVTCWGDTRYQDETGQVYLSEYGTRTKHRTDIKFISLKSGYLHICGTTFDGQIYCWGSSEYGQAGLENETPLRHQNINNPLKIDFENPIKSLAVGAYHNCAVDIENTIQCWGQGTGFSNNTQDIHYTPVNSFPDINPTEIEAGPDLTCFNIGNIKCFSTDKENLYEPFPATLSNLTDMTLKVNGICALDSQKSAWCSNPKISDNLTFANMRPQSWKPDNSLKTRWSRATAFWIRNLNHQDM